MCDKAISEMNEKELEFAQFECECYADNYGLKADVRKYYYDKAQTIKRRREELNMSGGR